MNETSYESTAFKEYDKLNSIVKKIFFNESAGEKPVYMDWADIDDEAIKKASDEKYKSKKELFEDLGKIIKSTLRLDHDENWKNGVFILHRIRAENWKNPDNKKYEILKQDPHYYLESNHPPVIALLAAFSNAAESMNASEDRAPTNYYKPLEDMLNITSEANKRNLQKSYHKDAELLWETLNQWLDNNDHIYGTPTAAPIFSNRNKVSYAESQALLRDADRKCLRKIFENPTYKISVYTRFQDIAKACLQDWIIQKNESTAQIKKFWNMGSDIQEKICETAIAEFEEWKIDQKDTPKHCEVNQNINLSWVINYDDEIEGEQIDFYMAANNFANKDNSRLEFKDKLNREILIDDADIFLKFDEYYKFSYIYPYENINILHLLHKPIELTLGEFNFNHMPNNIIMLAEHNGMYNEIIPSAYQRPSSLGVRQGVLCHKSIYEEVKKFIKDYSSSEYRELDLSVTNSIEDWHLFINVRFERAPSIDEINNTISAKNIALMIPNENSEDIIIEGGLRLIQHRWHEKNPPNIYSIDKSKEIVAKIKTQEDSQITLKEPDDLNKYKDDIENKNLEIKINSSSRTKKNIEFRSANKPRIQSIINKNNKLGYLQSSKTLYSAANIKDSNTSFFQGFLCNLEIQNMDLSTLNKYKDYKINFNIKNLTIKNQDYGYDKKNIKSDDNCVSRGHISWRIPSDFSKIKNKLQRKEEEEKERKKYGDNLDAMICLECGYSYNILKYKKKSKQKKKIPNKFNNRLSVDLENRKKNLASNFIKNREYKKANNISIDHVFDGLCYLWGGNGESLKRIISQAFNKPLDVKIIIENLINLGHIDVEKDKNMSVKQWKVSPIVLNIKDDEIFLSGFRSNNIINLLDDKFSKKYSWKINEQEQNLAPRKISWSSECVINEISLRDMMRNLNEIIDEEINVSKNSSINIMQNLRPFKEYFKFYETNAKEVDINVKYEKFNINNGKWESSLINQKGSYREIGGIAKNYYFNGENLIYAPHDIVKTKAALDGNKIIHEYDEGKKEFRCFINAEPPGIYKRALFAETGLLPSIQDGKKIYKNIPPTLGLLLMKKLYE